MRTRIKNLKRLISCCIALVLLLSSIGISETNAYAAENDFEEVTLLLNSTVTDDSSIDLYLFDSIHYITIDDLCLLTRCSQSIDGDVISVTQGFWSVTFDVEKQQFDDGYQSVPTTILKVSENEYAVPALMFLSYFKAIAFIENDTLYCRMPEFTAWEALNVDYSNSLVDIYELYGGEGNVTFSLTLDIIMDFIMGDMSTSDDYLSDAFLEALKVDLYDYSSVQKYKESSQNDLYSDLHSDKGEEFVEAIEDTLSVAAEPTQWYIQYYYNTIEKSFVRLAYDAFEAGQHTDVKHYGEKFYEAFTEKNKTSETAEKYFDNADYVMLFVSAAVDTAQQMKYTNATNNLVYNVMGQENLNYLGISADDNDWFTVANRYQNVLGVAATQIEAEAMQLFTDKLCWETLIGTGVSSAAGISGGAWTFSLNFARLFVENFPLTSSSVEAFKADRRALYLSELQQNVYWVAMNVLQNMQGQWDNLEIYTKYVQAMQLYCRTSIAMYENLITMVEEFGQNRDYWINLFQSRIDMLAVSLYQLTVLQDDEINNCLPLDISTFTIKNEASNEWREAYINYVNEHGNTYDSFGHAMEIYKLVNINNDSIPELYINFGTTAGGDVICTYYDGKVVEQPMWNYGFSYMEGQNIFRDAGGHMDVYHDKIYSIENGQFVLFHEGNYGAADNSHVQFDSDGNPIYDYYWDGTEVSSETEYMNLLNEVYNAQQAITPFDGAEYDSETWRYVGNGLCDYEEIIETINTY